ncbi:MAG: hypothetical protein IJA15_04640 [Clostridia bacterium]|nr:hypothetical protein [Clostridia bacterium]
MVNVYNSKDYNDAHASKKRILIGFFISLAVVLAITITLFIFYVRAEYDTPLRTPLLLACIFISSVYAIIMFFIFSIKYKRVASYVKMLHDMDVGMRTEGKNAFVRIDSSVTVKDGVDFISIIVLDWSEKKQEYFERNILFDVEKPIPEFKKGDIIKHVTHANILISYELAQTEIFE